MTELKFEGDLDGINKRQLEFIRSVLEKRGYKEETVLFGVIGKAGDNLVAIVKRLTVIKDGVTFKMIAKIAPDKAGFELVGENTAVMFRNEHYMYTHVLPKFNDMLQAVGVPEQDTLQYAECYGTYMEETNEVILLEDMELLDFQILDRFKSLDTNTVKLVLKNFAILHSASFALKEQEPETYELFCNNLINFWLISTEDEEKKKMFVKFEEQVISILDKDKYKEMVNGSPSQLGKYFRKNNDIDIISKYSVIEQGDPWTNNIMFRMEGDKAVKCCMIDYQVSKVGTPVGDINYLIFNCTDYETRSNHYHEWIDYYHSELDRSLTNFGLKANYVYSRDKLETDMRRYSKLSLGLSLFVSSLMMKETAVDTEPKKTIKAENGTANAMAETKISVLDEKSMLKYKNKIEGIMDSFLELGYFPAN